MAKLAGGVAQIRVGAATETEMKERKYLIEDAKSATQAALESGIVAGGGVALIRSEKSVEKLQLEGDEKLGATIVRVTADKPADGLIAFAKREGITHVVFGQTARSKWEILVRGSTLNRFLEEVRDAAVQVIPLGESAA